MTDRLNQLLGYLENQKDDSFILFAIAKEYESMNAFEKAEERYLYLKSVDPKYVGLYYHLGQLQEELEKTDDALSTYVEGIAVAKELKDHHALSELQGVKVNLEMGL